MFARQGFAVLPGLLSSAEVERARVGVARLVDNPGPGACERPNNTLLPLRWDDPLVALVAAGGDRVRQVTGATDLRWISGYVSIKDAGSPPLWWHQDWWCWDHPVSFRAAAVQIALLCYLAPTDAQTGALRVIPGSHRRSIALHASLPEAHGAQATEADLRHDCMRDHEDQVTLAASAGDAVVVDYRLLHGTHANASDRRRDCVLLSFAPGWSALPADIRGHLVCHPALPAPHENVASADPMRQFLPAFDGPRRDLALNRDAPARFEIGGQLPARSS
jgi:hypothetical protein